MVHKVRENDRVVAVERWLILGPRETGSSAAGVVGEPDGQHLVRRGSARDRGLERAEVAADVPVHKDRLVHEEITYVTLYRKRAITAHHSGIRFADE
jgi:hypothetical protein